MRKSALVLLVLCSICTSSCLKTRAQVKEEESNTPSTETQPNSAGTPAQVKDVDEHDSYAIDEIKGEMTRMNGRIEDLERKAGDSTQNGQPSKDDFKKLENRVIELEQAQTNMLEAIKKMQETQVAATADPMNALEAGKKSFNSKNYDAAIDQLSTYLKAPKGKHSEEATYLRGESYFQLKQYKKAIVDFSKFPEQYTHSKLMPQSLLRIGQSFDALGMKEDAAGFYQELTEKFPKSPEAKKARAKLR
jgi:tol-pal system protein YbgF